MAFAQFFNTHGARPMAAHVLCLQDTAELETIPLPAGKDIAVLTFHPAKSFHELQG